jgi:hypothetical protein
MTWSQFRRRLVFLAVVVAAAACTRDSASAVQSHDDPADPDEMVVRVYDVRDLTVTVPHFPGEDVNLDPTGEVTSAEEEPGVAAYRFPASWGVVHARRDALRPATAAPAPVTTWQRSRLAPHTSRLRVGDTETLPQEAFEASVRVDGARARVVLDCLFRNDRDRALEGTFELRLPDGASPWYLAFGECVQTAPTGAGDGAPAAPASRADVLFASGPADLAAARTGIWTAPKEARVVPRARAAWAYAETTRRRVDPALMEWSGAGVFSARVFPLAPARSHRVVIGYDVNLATVGDDLELRLDLPVGVPRRTVNVGVAGDSGVSTVPPAETRVDDGRTCVTFRDPAEEAVVVRIASPAPVLLQGTDPAAGPCFAVTFRPELPEAPARGGTERAVFLVDTSLSGNAEAFPVWLRLVREILERNRAATRSFAVLFFDVGQTWWREEFVPNTPENVDAFVAHAEQIALEGATDLAAALREGASPSWDRAGGRSAAHDVFLLSDGAATWGATEPHEIAAAATQGNAAAVWAYRSGLAGTVCATLEHVARETGGAVVSVVGDHEVAAAATAHARGGWRRSTRGRR